MASYYVDPSIAANSGTGTIGDPYGDLQYCLDTITRDVTNGDQINIKAGTAEVLTAEIDISTYGTPALGAGLAFAGYTSAENDGGQGEISGAATYSIWNKSTAEGIIFKDLILGNCGSAKVIGLDRFCAVRRCKIHGTSGDGVSGAAGSITIDECWFDDIGGIGVDNDCYVAGSLFTNGASNSFTDACQAGNVTRTCFKLSGTSVAINCSTNRNAVIENCSFYTTGTGDAINLRSIYATKIRGCLIQGFATGIDYSGTTEVTPGGHNYCAFYDNTTDADSAEFDGLNYNNESLSANLFDLSGGSITSFADRLTYFNPVDQGNVYTDMPGGLVKGAVQPAGSGGGGGATFHPLAES